MPRGPGSTLVRMGESLPSRGTPARDPDHPTSPGATADDPDTERDAADRDDDRLVTEIEALAARADPVPEEVVEAARRVFKAGRKKKAAGPSESSKRKPK
jgi:hypothetical protein